MNQRDPLEQERVNALKVARAAIRIRHSIAADNEINEKLAPLEQDIVELQQQGRGWQLDSKTLTILPGPDEVKMFGTDDADGYGPERAKS